MRKENSNIFVYLILLLSISACGVKGPLYQTVPQVKKQADTPKEMNSSNPSDKKQEK